MPLLLQPPLTLPQLLLAGMFVSLCVLVLGATQLMDLFNWLAPAPVVRGMQLAVGVKLAMKVLVLCKRTTVDAAFFEMHCIASFTPCGPSQSARPKELWLPCMGLRAGAARRVDVLQAPKHSA